MTAAPLAVVVLAAGKGTRMKSDLPKVLHPLAGRPMIAHVLEAAAALDPAQVVVVIGPDMQPLADAVAPLPTALQAAQLGTADAVRAARETVAELAAAGGDLMVLYGDGPLITGDTLAAMRAARGAGDFVWLGFRPDDPTGYGRMMRDDAGALTGIVEEKDASPEQRRIDLCWAGLLLGPAAALFEMIERIGKDNAKGEYYLTDLAGLVVEAGLRSTVVETDAQEVRGVNSRAELAAAEAALQARYRSRAMAEGATLIDPGSVWFSWDTVLGRDVVVQPHVVFGPGVVVGDGVEIRAFSHLEGATVAAGARIGPFARLRPGTAVGAHAHVGNFVELKAARLAAGVKAGHLSYLGDTEIGENANIGAGTITCNYDGIAKHRTEIGAGAFIGSNSALVAPVTVGAGAIVGAGTTLTVDVPDDALTVTRPEPRTLARGAARFRARRRRGG